MAQVNFTISGVSEGENWSGYLLFPARSVTQVNSTTVSTAPGTGGLTAVYLNSPAVNFSVAADGYFPTAANGEYITWRSATNSSTKYPTSGWGIDIWSNSLSSSQSNTWGNIVATNGGVYNLDAGKWSLFYFYDSPTAYAWSRGGTITFTVTA